MRFIATLFCFITICMAVAGGSASASADLCPGNPDALGTSRVLTISRASSAKSAACSTSRLCRSMTMRW